MAIRYTDIINLIRLPVGNLEIEVIEKKKKNLEKEVTPFLSTKTA